MEQFVGMLVQMGLVNTPNIEYIAARQHVHLPLLMLCLFSNLKI